jgi:uncharacterized protein (DUF1778 family)
MAMAHDEAVNLLAAAVQYYDDSPSDFALKAVLGCARTVVGSRPYPVADLTDLDRFTRRKDEPPPMTMADCRAALTALVYHSVVLMDGREVILAEDVRNVRDIMK